MSVLCQCYVSAMSVLCTCYVSAMSVLCQCYVSAMSVLCQCYVSAVMMPWIGQPRPSEAVAALSTSAKAPRTETFFMYGFHIDAATKIDIRVSSCDKDGSKCKMQVQACEAHSARLHFLTTIGDSIFLTDSPQK